jgi:tetratricopeptide (TPR) repeat protein
LEYWEHIKNAVNQPGKGISGLAIILGVMGRKEEAQYYLDQLHRRAEEDDKIDLDSELANGYAAMGEMDKAIHHLKACYEKRSGSIMFCLRHPLGAMFTNDKRYWELLEKMGLKKYYE